MNRLLIALCMVIMSAAWVCATAPTKASFQSWAAAAKLPGYTFGGEVEEDEEHPGNFMTGWMAADGEVIGVTLHPLTEFKSFQQTINHQKPESFTYKGMPALYTRATGNGQIAIKYEKSGKVLSIGHMKETGKPKAKSREELVKLLDRMMPEKLLK